MRDTVIFGLVPMMIKRPVIAALVFMWISLMSAHRLGHGPAYDFPFAMLTGVIAIIVYHDFGRIFIAKLFVSRGIDSAMLRQVSVLDAASRGLVREPVVDANCGTVHARS